MLERCEMCKTEKPAPWHQFRPVERWLCKECAEKDQLSAKNWHGEFNPPAPVLTENDIAALCGGSKAIKRARR